MAPVSELASSAPPRHLITPVAHPWFALCVRARSEFVSSRDLRAKGYEEFLPLYRARRNWSDRVKELEIPLFAGYLFCRFDAAHPYAVLNSAGVLHAVTAGRKFVPVDEQEVTSMQAMCRSGLVLEPWPFLQIGRRIIIERGPLTGAEGFILDFKHECRMVVSISLLQRSVAAEIDRAWVRPLS